MHVNFSFLAAVVLSVDLKNHKNSPSSLFTQLKLLINESFVPAERGLIIQIMTIMVYTQMFFVKLQF